MLRNIDEHVDAGKKPILQAVCVYLPSLSLKKIDTGFYTAFPFDKNE